MAFTPTEHEYTFEFRTKDFGDLGWYPADNLVQAKRRLWAQLEALHYSAVMKYLKDGGEYELIKTKERRTYYGPVSIK